jgi:O-antigen/teichoic acid export membrane protein
MLRFAGQNLWRATAAVAASAAVAAATGSALAALTADAIVSLTLAQRYFEQSLSRAHLGAGAALALAWRRLPSVQWNSALQLSSVMAIAFVVLNADRWAAADMLDATRFAHYSFAWTVLSVAQSAQAVVNASVYPMLARRYGEGGRSRAFDLSVRVSIGVFVFGAVLAIPAALGAAWAIEHWYPAYAGAIVLLPIFVGVAVLRLSDFWSSFLLIVGLEGRLLRLNFITATLAVAAWMIAIRSEFGALSPLVQVGTLAAALTLSNYIAVAVAARRARTA